MTTQAEVDFGIRAEFFLASVVIVCSACLGDYVNQPYKQGEIL